MRGYILIAKDKRIPVTYDVCKTYYQEYEHERYLENKPAKYEHSLEQCIETDAFTKFICLYGLTIAGDGVFRSE